MHLHTRSDGDLFNLKRLRAQFQARKVLLRELLFIDDAAMVSHTEATLQNLIASFANACKFDLTTSIKNSHVLCQDLSGAPSISIDDA